MAVALGDMTPMWSSEDRPAEATVEQGRAEGVLIIRRRQRGTHVRHLGFGGDVIDPWRGAVM